MKKLGKIIKSAIICLTLCLICATQTYALDSNRSYIQIEIKEFEQSSSVWKPGDTRNIIFTIKNNSSKLMTVNKIYMVEKSSIILTKAEKAFKEMATNTYIIIKDEEGIQKERTSLDSILSKNGDNVGQLTKNIKLSPGQKKEFTMTIDMDTKMGNDAQSLSTVLNIGAIYNLTDTGGGGTIEQEDPKPSEPEDAKPPNPEDPKPSEPEDPNPEDPKPSEPEAPKPPNPEGTKPSEPVNPDDQNNGSDVGGNGDKLPQTGGIINGATLTIVGIVVAGVGIVLDRKSSDKGGESDE